MKKIILDYGVGSIDAVFNACDRLGLDVGVTNDFDSVMNATHIILPGVGAFDTAMHHMIDAGLDVALRGAAKKNVFILGICLGMQLLANSSDEGSLEGLGLIEGHIFKIPTGVEKIPNMGWKFLHVKKENRIFKSNELNRYYFAHGYYFSPVSKDTIIATIEHNIPIAAVVKNGNVWGVQFHPEKSHKAGLSVIDGFLKLSLND